MVKKTAHKKSSEDHFAKPVKTAAIPSLAKKLLNKNTNVAFQEASFSRTVFSKPSLTIFYLVFNKMINAKILVELEINNSLIAQSIASK